jgi:hypothetical protein
MKKKIPFRFRVTSMFFGICAIIFAGICGYWVLDDFDHNRIDGVVVFFLMTIWTARNAYHSCDFALFHKTYEA